jgi:2Fe-2S ferredoxin
MTTITFIHPDGRSHNVEAGNGSVMQLAVANGVDEIVAECGGYVDDRWIDRLPAISDAEDALLDGTASDRLPSSRLSCQIRITPELDGLVLRLPDRQV